MTESDWQSLPDSVGDWLYVTMMPCDCCVDLVGIVFVCDSKINKMIDLGNGFFVDWTEPEENLKYIYHWKKIQLPEMY